jgi:hypothetical protein
MKEREILEAAARAARLSNTQWVGDEYTVGYLALESGREWNPLHDDGDAFRLITSVPLSVDVVDDVVIIGHGGKRIWSVECPDGKYRSGIVRLALVEAAAYLADTGGVKPRRDLPPR